MKKILFIVVLFIFSVARADYFQDGAGKLYYLDHVDVMKGWASHLPAGTISISDSAASGVIASQVAANAAIAAALPNKAAFVVDMDAALGGIIPANNYAKAYPLFMPAFDANDWPSVSAMLIDAQSTVVITPTQYTAIKSAATNRHIPLTLP